jgi:hypothetical protein
MRAEHFDCQANASVMLRLVVVRGNKIGGRVDQSFGAVPSGHSGISAFGSY